jgi:hypothetical protein
MALTYNLKTDIRYKQGREEGITSIVKNLLLKGKMGLQEIAEAAEVSLDFVKSIKMQLGL